MWIVRWIAMLLIMLLIIGFAMLNTKQAVTVSFYWWETVNMPLWVVMYISFAAGMIVWLFVSIFQVVGLKNGMRKLQKQNRQLKDELDRMRNVSIDETVVSEPKEGETHFDSFEE